MNTLLLGDSGSENEHPIEYPTNYESRYQTLQHTSPYFPTSLENDFGSEEREVIDLSNENIACIVSDNEGVFIDQVNGLTIFGTMKINEEMIILIKHFGEEEVAGYFEFLQDLYNSGAQTVFAISSVINDCRLGELQFLSSMINAYADKDGKAKHFELVLPNKAHEVDHRPPVIVFKNGTVSLYVNGTLDPNVYNVQLLPNTNLITRNSTIATKDGTFLQLENQLQVEDSYYLNVDRQAVLSNYDLRGHNHVSLN